MKIKSSISLTSENEERFCNIKEKKQFAKKLLQAWREYENCPGMGFPNTEEFLDRFFKKKK
jgi:hypothetical protein